MKAFWFIAYFSSILLQAHTTSGLNQPCHFGYSGEKTSSVYFPPYFHWAIAFSDYEGTITLEDGSVWSISNYKSISDWHQNDPLTINIVSQEGWFFDDPPYYEIKNLNERKKNTVKASLTKAPILKGEYTRQILAFDLTNKIITLTDHSRWYLDAPDFSRCYNWAIGDCIIVGKRPKGNYLLINVNLNLYIEAKLKGWIYGITHN